jgi:hypothetical protein
MSTAQGDVWGDVLLGLDYAGFQFSGQRNPLSDGVNINVARNFQNTPIDFGFNELALTGPVAASVTTSNRGMRTLDFTFTLGTAANPLFYAFESDVGSSAVRMNGSAVFRIDGSINQFGWYDLRILGSHRGEATSTGRFANTDGDTLDFDIGPIDVSGNIFADLLATMTDPLFENGGYENPFASFSGRTARENALESTVSRLKTKAAAGKNVSQNEVAQLVRMAAEAGFHGDDVPSLLFLEDLYVGQAEPIPLADPSRVVPEPSSLVLLVIPACLCLRRRRR